MTETRTPTPPAIPEGYIQDAKGRLVPLELVKDHEQLEDDTVRKIIGFAEELSAQIARFRGHTFDDVASFQDLLREKYGARRGGRKGNIQLTTYDGTLRVTVNVQDTIDFGPELQVAKELFDCCVRAWSDGADAKIVALVEHAFQVDRKGRINRESLFGLRRLDIDDPHWRAAVEALNDSIRTVGSREYVRCHRRASPRDRWELIPIDLANARTFGAAAGAAGDGAG